jgi:hypothetical protein
MILLTRGILRSRPPDLQHATCPVCGDKNKEASCVRVHHDIFFPCPFPYPLLCMRSRIFPAVFSEEPRFFFSSRRHGGAAVYTHDSASSLLSRRRSYPKRRHYSLQRPVKSSWHVSTMAAHVVAAAAIAQYRSYKPRASKLQRVTVDAASWPRFCKCLPPELLAVDDGAASGQSLCDKARGYPTTCSAGAAKVFHRSYNGGPPELQSCTAEAASGEHSSCRRRHRAASPPSSAAAVLQARHHVRSQCCEPVVECCRNVAIPSAAAASTVGRHRRCCKGLVHGHGPWGSCDGA